MTFPVAALGANSVSARHLIPRLIGAGHRVLSRRRSTSRM
jgi:hypothetical protein